MMISCTNKCDWLGWKLIITFLNSEKEKKTFINNHYWRYGIKLNQMKIIKSQKSLHFIYEWIEWMNEWIFHYFFSSFISSSSSHRKSVTGFPHMWQSIWPTQQSRHVPGCLQGKLIVIVRLTLQTTHAWYIGDIFNLKILWYKIHSINKLSFMFLFAFSLKYLFPS
jgi:hypothetical protein